MVWFGSVAGERCSRMFHRKRHYYGGLLLLLLLLGGCGQLDFAVGPLLYDVRVTPDAITPNADGDQDITEIFYSLRRPANVSIFFENEAEERFYFRRDRRRSPGDYSVQWGGVVDEPEIQETDYGPQEILSRVLDDGTYTWYIEATDEAGAIERASGTITLQDGDTEVPELHNFAVVPDIFRPNQDGMRDDWVSISYYLTKDVDQVLLYLSSEADPDFKYFITETPGVVQPTERGYHDYRYEGGVDLNAEPPPDGTYAIIGEARDRAGNAVRVQRTLTVEEGGKPRADVAQGEIHWRAEWGDQRWEEMNRVAEVPLDGKLCFSAVVTNESTVPIRTSGPWPGEEYQFNENSNTLARDQSEESWQQQPGVWRFGINFDTSGLDFPYRWAIGRQEQLERRIDDTGHEQWYLLPGKSGEVEGCIVMDQAPPLGTQFWWGGLIHQSVSVPNNNIDRITVNVHVP